MALRREQQMRTAYGDPPSCPFRSLQTAFSRSTKRISLSESKAEGSKSVIKAAHEVDTTHADNVDFGIERVDPEQS